jgi:hypothetical protein
MGLGLAFKNKRCSEQEQNRKETTLAVASIRSVGLPARKGPRWQTNGVETYSNAAVRHSFPDALDAGSIAAFFPQGGSAALEPVGRCDRWIDCPVHPTGWWRPEISVAGLLVPWIVSIGALGFLAAWLVTAILERTDLARHVWHLPLCFLALVILFSSLFGAAFFP